MTNYLEIIQILPNLIENNAYDITILANTSALLFEKVEQINWAGFYLKRNGKLILGPFQGKIACIEIPLNKGVCGACARSLNTIIVGDVHQFSGHIACDSTSNSEICIPIFVHNELYAILDIDSPILYRFKEEDQFALEQIGKIISTALEKCIKN